MVNLAGDYGGANAIANRQAAATRYTPPPTAPVQSAIPRVSTGPTGSYSARPVAPMAVNPGPIDINSWLGTDTDYQNNIRNLQLALSNFNSDVTRRQGLVGTDFATNEHALEAQKVQDLKNLEADWAGRGLLRSGLYADAVGNYNTEWDQRASDLASSRDNALAQLLQEQQAFSTQQSLDTQAAREAAIRRRAASLGTVA